MYLVLIDSRVPDIQSIVASFTANTEYITFDFFSDTYSSIQDKIVTSYESVAIIQHNYFLNTYKFVADSSDAIIYGVESDDPELNTWQQYLDFLHWLKTERGAQYVDLMACNLWADPGWKYMIETARSRYGIYIRASIDITGEDGDFILESDNFNTIGVYFTEDILQYKYAFYYDGYLGGDVNTPFTYIFPDSNLAKLTTRYSNILGILSSGSYTNVKCVVSSQLASAVLMSNGNVSVFGNPSQRLNFGGAMPCGVVTQADLVSISRIFSYQFGFVAIKTNGSVITWGTINSGAVATNDINNTTDTEWINFNSVRSQCVSVIDVKVNQNISFAALNSDGSVVTWGRKNWGGDKGTNSAFLTFLSTGITKIVGTPQTFFALKNTGVVVQWAIGAIGNNPIYSTAYFTSSTPVVNIVGSANTNTALYVRQNGSVFDILLSTAATVYYTLPAGVTVLKILTNPATSSNFFLLFSNNSVGTLLNGVWTLYTNATDVAVSGFGGAGAFAIIQGTSVIVGGAANFGGSLTNTTYGLKSGLNLTNPVRLVSTANSLGCIKSDNTFVWWGQINNPFYVGATFPAAGDADAVRRYNAYNGLSISSVYTTKNGYAIVRTDGSFSTLGYIVYNGFGNTTDFERKDASTNVYFAPQSDALIPLEVPYLPSVTPSSISGSTSAVVSYYVSNPDKMAYWGRKYRLYDGATLIDTFIPTQDTPTYVFSNVNIPSGGVKTLTIKDETNISYTVDTFTLTVIQFNPCFLEGSKILRFNPETYQEEYVPVQTLRRGDLIATAESGYKALHSIGYRTIRNPKSDPILSNRLYRFSRTNCPEVFEPLYITGEHCTLHRSVPNEKRRKITEHMGDVYITEEFYRIPAFMDDRAEPYDRSDKSATIWHFALENENVAHNYGVYANGLLVESCAIESLLIKSGMKLVD